MSEQVNMHEAKTHFSRLAERAANGEEIVIARAGRPLAKLGPIEAKPKARKLGAWSGKVTVSADFDAYDEQVRALVEGEAE